MSESQLRKLIEQAVIRHFRTGCEDTPLSACATAVALDVEDALRTGRKAARRVTDRGAQQKRR